MRKHGAYASALVVFVSATAWFVRVNGASTIEAFPLLDPFARIRIVSGVCVLASCLVAYDAVNSRYFALIATNAQGFSAFGPSRNGRYAFRVHPSAIVKPDDTVSYALNRCCFRLTVKCEANLLSFFECH